MKKSYFSDIIDDLFAHAQTINNVSKKLMSKNCNIQYQKKEVDQLREKLDLASDTDHIDSFYNKLNQELEETLSPEWKIENHKVDVSKNSKNSEIDYQFSYKLKKENNINNN